VAVTLRDFAGHSGEAMAMGERTPLALIDAPAAARLAIAEAITNIAAAGVRKLGDVKLSANWMAAAGDAGEDAALFDTVRAITLGFCIPLGLSIPVGKDSLSMRTKWRDGEGDKSSARRDDHTRAGRLAFLRQISGKCRRRHVEYNGPDRRILDRFFLLRPVFRPRRRTRIKVDHLRSGTRIQQDHKGRPDRPATDHPCRSCHNSFSDFAFGSIILAATLCHETMPRMPAGLRGRFTELLSR
jgi:hypothetical protein